MRLASGAIALVVVSFLFANKSSRAESVGRSVRSGSWLSAMWLAAYAICFSLAYLRLTAGTGALILFGSVQMTMIVISLGKGERPKVVEWIGLAVAACGLVYLVLPGLASPPLNSALLMAVAGAAWAFYTLRGKGGEDPRAETTGNFVRSLAVVPVLVLVFWPALHLTARGWMLAILSGAVTSGIGYTIWYAALKYLTSTRAAVLQLAVPVIAAVIGVVWLGETASATFLVASLMIVGGIGLVISARRAV